MVIVLGAGGPRDAAYIPLATRRGSRIRNERRPEQPPVRLKAAVQHWTQAYPEIRVRSVTGVYNCMGLAFASRRTWVDTDQLSMILDEDEYHRIRGPQEMQVGDLVVYRRNGEAAHIAVVVKLEPLVATASWKVTVVSQWGADGEYVHPMEDVPELLGTPVEYWTDRR